MSDTESVEMLAVYSDYVCPFCYLGRASMEQYRADREAPLDVEWRFFDLRGQRRRPDGSLDESMDDGKDEDYYEQARKNVRRLAERYDVEMELDIAGDVDSWNAQLLALRVRQTHDEETFRAFHNAVFDALWRDGRDIGDPAVLEDIAQSVGVDPTHVAPALEEDGLEEELRARFREATERGITGIPTFVYDGYVARGAVPPEQLERLVEGV